MNNEIAKTFKALDTLTAPDMESLGQRAAACKHWKWMRGMANQHGDRMLYAGVGNQWASMAEVFEFDNDEMGALIPDLTDPATLGCLLHLVREACGHLGFYATMPSRTGQFAAAYFDGQDFQRIGYPFSSEAEALVASLEQASSTDFMRSLFDAEFDFAAYEKFHGSGADRE